MQKNYSNFTIGYSDHTIGISAPVVSVAMGAKIIEKHITIDRNMKGTDQAGSLGPDGVSRMIRDIRITEMSLGKENIFIDECVTEAKKKLERSIASKRNIKKGETITENDLQMLSPGDGLKWNKKNLIIGKIAKTDIPINGIIYLKNVINGHNKK